MKTRLLLVTLASLVACRTAGGTQDAPLDRLHSDLRSGVATINGSMTIQGEDLRMVEDVVLIDDARVTYPDERVTTASRARIEYEDGFWQLKFEGVEIVGVDGSRQQVDSLDARIRDHNARD